MKYTVNRKQAPRSNTTECNENCIPNIDKKVCERKLRIDILKKKKILL